MQERGSDLVVPISVNDVHSGDVFASLKLDGIDPFITAITGSHVGHIQVALEVDGEMKVCESQDAPYWPVHGWQCNSFDDFVQWTKDALFNTVHLRLASPYREKFDAKKVKIFIYLFISFDLLFYFILY
jgi:hypothetical protein